jgi:hypothetical protein
MKSLGGLEAADVAAVMVGFRDALRSHQGYVNRLNVYPVPDGDTGTNMALTVQSVVDELDSVADLADMALVSKAVAHGSLMGARGNSGVILSQLLRGFTGALSGKNALDAALLAGALVAAADAAYSAVLRPVEGTILTVARSVGEGALEAAESSTSLLEVAQAARRSGGEALARTPSQLPALAQAGVVDAGGTGYLLFLDALLTVLDGRPLPPAPAVPEDEGALRSPARRHDDEAEGPPELRYEVMYLLNAPDDTIPAFKEVWAGIGDSIVVVGGDGLWNCHIHTDDVGAAIEAALDAGRPRNIRVTDLIEQVEEERWVREGADLPGAAQEPLGPPPRTAVIAVANGEGIGRIFRSLGVHHLVAGGQSMNPSIAEILEVVEAAASPEVVILPNNDNIRPVAAQAAELAGKPAWIVPTSGIVEGFAALLEYDPQAGAEENARAMASSAQRIVAGEVTQAVRPAETPAGSVVAGDWLGVSREGIEVVAPTLFDATCGLLSRLLTPAHELVTLIEGDGAGVAETRKISQWLATEYPDVSLEVHHGGQPLYPYLLSIE